MRTSVGYFPGHRFVIALIWLAAIAFIGWWSASEFSSGAYSGDALGGDAKNYLVAIDSMRQGGDVYRDGIGTLRDYLATAGVNASRRAPLVYWYPPLSLHIFKFLAPLRDSTLVYLYAAVFTLSWLILLKVGYSLASVQERKWLQFLLPLCVFFPGLLADLGVFALNIAIILYALILLGAQRGWRHNRWFWFYLAVFFAAIFKPYMLTLLALPLLTGRRQWRPAIFAAISGLALFALQAWLWPQQMEEFRQLYQLVQTSTHDFGYGPSGLFCQFLWRHGVQTGSIFPGCSLVWIAALFAALSFLSLRLKENPELRDSWRPIALIGVICLSPRVTACETSAVMIPMLLVCLRAAACFVRQARPEEGAALAALTGKSGGTSRSLAVFLGLFVALNLLNSLAPAWFTTEFYTLAAVLVVALVSALRLRHFAQLSTSRANLHANLCPN